MMEPAAFVATQDSGAFADQTDPFEKTIRRSIAAQLKPDIQLRSFVAVELFMLQQKRVHRKPFAGPRGEPNHVWYQRRCFAKVTGLPEPLLSMMVTFERPIAIECWSVLTEKGPCRLRG